VSLRGSMTDPPPSTMAPPEAAAPSHDRTQARTPPSTTPGPQVTKSLVTRDYDFALRAFFPTPVAPMKFNPISAMNHLLRMMLKDEPSLVIRTSNNDKQIILAADPLPTGETGFKKFFKVSTVRIEQQHKSHVCIGCNVLSNRTLGNIKFKSSDGHLLAWLKKERVFVESDGLGIDRPVTIGHFIKIAPDLTNLANFRDSLANQLMLIDIDADTAVALAPHLKDAQLDAMTNGDEYVTILPPFEIYRTRITHGREPIQVSTDVLGVKSAPQDAKLLGEFFMRLASDTSNDHRDGIFLPKGAVHQLGLPTYEQMLKENNFFLTQVATVPVNLEYDAWFAVIDQNAATDNEPISLYEHLIRKPWFLRIESVGRNKCLIVTTRHNLPEARAWIDENLEAMIRKSIPTGIDPPSSLLPKRLDKPVYTKTSQSYADVLKKQFSLNPNPQTQNNEHNRPPRKRQATVIDYDSDQSVNPPISTPTTTISTSGSCNSTATAQASTNPVTATVNYDAELMSIKTELNSLRAIITSAVEQIKNAIASLQVQPLPSHAMETVATPTQNPIDLPALIQDLKQDIANIVRETRNMLNQPLTAMMELDNLSSIT